MAHLINACTCSKPEHNKVEMGLLEFMKIKLQRYMTKCYAQEIFNYEDIFERVESDLFSFLHNSIWLLLMPTPNKR